MKPNSIEQKTRIETCAKHGEYEAQVIEGIGITQPCPGCMADREKQKLLDEQRELEIQRSHNIAIATGALQKELPKRFAHCSFDNYKAECETSKRMLTKCHSYASNFSKVRERGTSLMFCGTPGTGKTHMAISICKQIATDGYRSRYLPLTQLLREVRSTWSDGGHSEEFALKKLAQLDLLVIDEIGVQTGSDNERKILFEIIDGRYMNMAPTILLSNLPQNEIVELIGERVVDRFYENNGGVMVFNWESYRSRGAAA